VTDAEPTFQDDLDTMEQAVTDALNELSEVPAYVLKSDEIQDFKAAQYALRNLSPDKTSDHDVQGVYDD
jgi:hypothetical protein